MANADPRSPAEPNLTLSTVDASGNVKARTVSAGTLWCSASAQCAGGQACTFNGSIGSPTLGAGLYLVRVGNTANGTFGDFASFVVTDPSGKLGTTA